MTTTTHNRLADAGLLVLRLALAAVFLFHGAQKLFGLFGGYGIEGTAGFMASLGLPLPTLAALLAGSAEFFGGIVLLLGTGTRIAAIPMAFVMLMATITVHRHAFAASDGGMEFTLTLLAALVALALVGPGRLTIGRLIASLTHRRTTQRDATGTAVARQAVHA